MSSFQTLAPLTKVTKTAPTAVKVKKEMVRNAGGHFVFDIGQHGFLDRFLILGTEGGKCYAGQTASLTAQSTPKVIALAKSSGSYVVERCVEISQAGRAKKNDYALYAMAAASAYGDDKAKDAVLRSLPLVARTGTDLFHFVTFSRGMRGWGRSFKNTIRNWYTCKEVQNLAYSMVKYQSRDGWSHRDILRLTHMNASSEEARNNLYKWAVKGDGALKTGDMVPTILIAYEQAKTAKKSELVKLIQDHNLSHEMIPNDMKNEPEIWEALLQKMKPTAMLRNLGKMTNVGLVSTFSDASKLVIARLNDVDYLQKDRIHPLTVYVAKKTYGQGHGDLGSMTWTPDSGVVSALETGFYNAFKTITPTGKNMLLAIDVSGSMGMHNCVGIPWLKAREGAAIMAMVTARVEENSRIFGFDHNFRDMGITATDNIETVKRKLSSQTFGTTDPSLPAIHAAKNNWNVDAFCIYTDNEVNTGIHPFQAMNSYRKKMNKPDAKLIVCGMSMTNFTVADPSDPYSMDVVGFDSDAPRIISDFAAGLI